MSNSVSLGKLLYFVGACTKRHMRSIILNAIALRWSFEIRTSRLISHFKIYAIIIIMFETFKYIKLIYNFF